MFCMPTVPPVSGNNAFLGRLPSPSSSADGQNQLYWASLLFSPRNSLNFLHGGVPFSLERGQRSAALPRAAHRHICKELAEFLCPRCWNPSPFLIFFSLLYVGEEGRSGGGGLFLIERKRISKNPHLSCRIKTRGGLWAGPSAPASSSTEERGKKTRISILS